MKVGNSLMTDLFFLSLTTLDHAIPATRSWLPVHALNLFYSTLLSVRAYRSCLFFAFQGIPCDLPVPL